LKFPSIPPSFLLLALSITQLTSTSNAPLKTKSSSIMSNRALPVIGLAAAGGVGYYLYSAGGDPKLAEKKAERMLPMAIRAVDLV
jgi:hypothetical protein